MRVVHLVYLLLFVGLVVVACEKDSVAVVDEPMVEEPLYTVPEIPAEIADLMTAEDRARFEAGPGEAYLARAEAAAARWRARPHRPRWHPVILKLDYNLAFVPIGGDCASGNFYPCFDETGPNPACFPPNQPPAFTGSTGYTYAEGYWRGHQPLFAEYWQTFCAPDYAGGGQGNYQVNGPDNKLFLSAYTTPMVPTPVLGNCVDFYFYRFGEYTGGEGMFEGAIGWEISRIFTLAENDPGCDPNGLGLSTAVTFGWAYY
jgi:hypothetical protein